MNSHLDMLHEVDLVVGSLVSAMEERLIMNDTIIIFTSDNGGLAKSQQFSHYTNGILRGNKGQIWEGGHRVPMIWRYDGVFPENETRENLIGLNDVFATLCEIAGVDIPYGSAYDSIHLRHTLPRTPRLKCFESNWEPGRIILMGGGNNFYKR